jgi:hypothetical protein
MERKREISEAVVARCDHRETPQHKHHQKIESMAMDSLT